MDIGSKIKEYRKKMNLTQKEFAKKINKSERMIQKYESNDVIPSIEVLNEIAGTLNIKITDLFPSKKIPLQSLVDLTGASRKEIIDSDGKKTLITSIPNGNERMGELYKSLKTLLDNMPKDEAKQKEINDIFTKTDKIVDMYKNGEMKAISQEELHKTLFSKFPYMDSTNTIIFKNENMKIAFEHFKILINYCNNFKGIPDDKKSIEKYCEMFAKTIQYIDDELEKLNKSENK